MKKLIILCILCLGGCTNGMSILSSGTTMERIQFPRIFIQEGNSNYGINFQCPPGALSDCVGAVMGHGLTINKSNNR